MPHLDSPLINSGGLVTSGLLTNGLNGLCPKCRHKFGDGFPCKACGFKPDSDASGIQSGPAVDTLTFAKWCSFLAVAVLRTRSPFASFLAQTLHLPRSDVASSSPTFPLPCPYVGIFAKMPLGLSSAKRRRIHFKRAVHVVIMALNFWWSNNSFIPLELLGRIPSPSQLRLFRRVASLMLADGPVEPFEVLQSGRRFHFLTARLGELSDAVTKLGAGAGPYEKVYAGHTVPLDDSVFPELEPYKSLNASRLKVVGTGAFDATEFLPPDLCMAYRFPDSLLSERIPEPFEFPQKLDPEAEVVKLAKVWDARGLLYIHNVDIQMERPFEMVRVFNCLKNVEVDRQIGDRRGRNAVENRVSGPSAHLPSGSDLLDIVVDASHETLSVICTDRRDFYHQFATSLNRTMSNTVGPKIPLSLLQDTRAFDTFVAAKRAKKPPRAELGDQLGFSARQRFSRCPPDMCMISFKSIFQGDHAGVEIATAAHEGLLRSVGLLADESRVIAGMPFRGDRLCEGLVIDDYFAIAKVPKGVLVPNPAIDCLAKSKELYLMHGIIGSDDKDVAGAQKAKVIGASVNASSSCLNRGHVIIASPAEKRFALSWLTLQNAQLSHTSDVLHLCLLGGWTSLLMFRRPFMSVLQKAFHLVDLSKLDNANPKLIRLNRQVANELTLLSVLAPLIVSDVAVQFCEEIFATDASLNKGAIVSCAPGRDIVEVLWKSCRSKGGYSKLLTQEQAILSRSLEFEEADVPKSQNVHRPLAFRFAFIEVFAGAATVTACMAQRGFSVCNPIDISFDRELDVSQVHVLEWILHLVDNLLVSAVMIEPPCTTFSIMRKPALRSSAFPFGFNLEDLQTSLGTRLGYRAFQILYKCAKRGITAVLENPWSSMIKLLPGWKIIANLDCCELVRCDSCAYGSIHLKSFAFLCVWAEVAPISLRCDGMHSHVPIQGVFTKKSATYVESLSEALADVMEIGIQRLLTFEQQFDNCDPGGIENQLVNEICAAQQWKVVSSWTFRISAHINLLELAAVVRLVTRLVKEGSAKRLVILVDSNVVRCAASKGRSSSRALSKLLTRLAALSVVGGLYIVWGFCPTRLNPADDPTRDVELRTPIPGMDLAAWDRSDLFQLACFPRLRRWASNWSRLVVSVLGPRVLSFADKSCHRVGAFPYGLASSAWPLTRDQPTSGMDFDSTLGYPGEGPLQRLVSICAPLSLLWIGLFVGHFRLTHGVLFPRNAGDVQRQSLRNSRPPLQEGRPVLGITSKLRVSFYAQFDGWLAELGISLEAMLDSHFQYIDDINKCLVRYGRALYASGRPYNHYAETINSIASKRPAIRRQLQEAWNLAYAWVRDEPSTHHLAMPWQVLLSTLSVCFLWGWMDLAGMLALTWGALLRVGEFLQATRSDLLLPVDTQYTNNFALLSLREPKTRFTAARHQSAKLDIPDLLHVVHLAFAKLHPLQKLWPKTGQTLRLRFKQVLQAIGLDTVRLNGKTLDLGSLRPGGATWIIQQTEDGELCRRRGRWINQRVMEIYIQEVSSFQYLSRIPGAIRQKVFGLCDFFPVALRQVDLFRSADIPSTVWFLIWRGQDTR